MSLGLGQGKRPNNSNLLKNLENSIHAANAAAAANAANAAAAEKKQRNNAFAAAVEEEAARQNENARLQKAVAAGQAPQPQESVQKKTWKALGMQLSAQQERRKQQGRGRSHTRHARNRSRRHRRHGRTRKA